MRLHVRHADGKKSIWDIEPGISFSEARRVVSEAVKEETGSLPLVVLALVTADFK